MTGDAKLEELGGVSRVAGSEWDEYVGVMGDGICDEPELVGMPVGPVAALRFSK